MGARTAKFLSGISPARIAIIVAIIVILAAVYLLALRGPTELVFASTQLNPPAEQAFVKEQLLPGFVEATGISVTFLPISYDELVARLEAEVRAGDVTISVVGDLHGNLDYYAS
jgi:multiple sugar transport system substrate-binding protein